MARTTTTLRWLERLAWAVGVVCLTTVGWTWAASARAEGEAGRELDRRAVEHRIAQAQNEVLASLGDGIEGTDTPAAAFPARLEIPRLDLAVLVSPGTGADILDLTAGHIEGTALPGSSGHVALAAHRDRHFRPLEGVRKGDLVTLTTPAGTVRYSVESTKVVFPEDVHVLDPTPYPSLSLVTCHPFDFVGPAPGRFVVHARRLS